MLPRGRRRGRVLLAPPVELPAEYLKKYPHSNRGVLCSQGRKKGDYHQSMDGNVFTDCCKVVLLPALAELGGMAARGRAARGRALRANHGGRLEGRRARRDIVDALRWVASEGELCSHCDGVAPWREPLARPQRIVAGLP